MDSSKAAAEWDKANTKQFKVKLNRNTDSDIIDMFATVENKQGYLKHLIRADMTGARVYTQYTRIEQGNPLQIGTPSRIDNSPDE